jgi:hypothetical protein
MKNKRLKVATAALEAAIAEMEISKIVFTDEDAAASGTGWHINAPAVACALANHPQILEATDRQLLKLLPYLDAATLYEYNAFECFGRDDIARASDNVRRVVKDLPKYLRPIVDSADGKPFSIIYTRRKADFSYSVSNGQCSLNISPLASDTEQFFTHLWSSLEMYGNRSPHRQGRLSGYSRAEFVRRCKCGRYFVAKTIRTLFCSRTCIEGDKRLRYAQLPDRAEDQALSMMLVNYRRRYNRRSPSKQHVLKWLETYRQKRKGKKSVSTRPLEAVLTKL